MSRTPTVIDFQEAREQRQEAQRRLAERVFMQTAVSAFCVVGENSLKQIELVDLSDTGCGFLLVHSDEPAWDYQKRELSLRLYFSQDQYLEIGVRVQNMADTIKQGSRFVRFGCEVDQSLTSYVTYQAFVNFLHLYCMSAKKDNGDTNLYFV